MEVAGAHWKSEGGSKPELGGVEERDKGRALESHLFTRASLEETGWMVTSLSLQRESQKKRRFWKRRWCGQVHHMERSDGPLDRGTAARAS